MRRKSLGKLVKRMIYVASLPWVPSLTYLPCSFLLQTKSFERVFPGWHIELSSISLVPATHAVGSIVQYLCFREKKKKKGIIFLLSLCVLLQSSEQLCVPALTNEKGCLSGKRSLCRHSNTFLIYFYLFSQVTDWHFLQTPSDLHNPFLWLLTLHALKHWWAKYGPWTQEKSLKIIAYVGIDGSTNRGRGPGGTNAFFFNDLPTAMSR